MEPGALGRFNPAAVALWRRARVWAGRVPPKAWVVLVLFLVAASLMAFHTAVADKTSTLHLRVQHGFRSAQLFVYVDDDLAYSGKLTGSPRKKFGLIPDSVQGSLSRLVSVAPGRHRIRIRVSSEDGSVQEDMISGEFARNSERDLSVGARRSSLSLSWQPLAGEQHADNSSGSGWFHRYAGSLFLTIAGSIISALTGYLIKELPRQIGSRQLPPDTIDEPRQA